MIFKLAGKLQEDTSAYDFVCRRLLADLDEDDLSDHSDDSYIFIDSERCAVVGRNKHSIICRFPAKVAPWEVWLLFEGGVALL